MHLSKQHLKTFSVWGQFYKYAIQYTATSQNMYSATVILEDFSDSWWLFLALLFDLGRILERFHSTNLMVILTVEVIRHIKLILMGFRGKTGWIILEYVSKFLYFDVWSHELVSNFITIVPLNELCCRFYFLIKVC